LERRLGVDYEVPSKGECHAEQDNDIYQSQRAGYSRLSQGFDFLGIRASGWRVERAKSLLHNGNREGVAWNLQEFARLGEVEEFVERGLIHRTQRKAATL